MSRAIDQALLLGSVRSSAGSDASSESNGGSVSSSSEGINTTKCQRLRVVVYGDGGGGDGAPSASQTVQVFADAFLVQLCSRILCVRPLLFHSKTCLYAKDTSIGDRRAWCRAHQYGVVAW